MGTTLVTLQDAASVHGLLVHPRSSLECLFHQCRESSFQSAPPPPIVCREEKSWSVTGIGICCVSGCAVILVLQAGSPLKRTDENDYPTSCQDGIKTVALRRGEDDGIRPSDLFACVYDHCEDHPSWLAHAPSFLASDRN